MTDFPDPLRLAPETRFAVAERVRLAHDIELPWLPNWNDQPCQRHADAGLEVPLAECDHCGVRPRRIQRTGITWLFFTPRALLADATGLGKTVQSAGLLALAGSVGSLGTGPGRRALIVARAPTLIQWRDQLARMVPSLVTTCVTGDRRQRARALLSTPWEAALCGPEMLVSKASRASDQVADFDIGTVIIDDVEAIRNLNKTSKVLQGLCAGADRVVVCTATPLDKRLTQLYDLGAGFLGWSSFLGNREEFQHRYVHRDQVWYTPRLKPTRCRYCKGVLLANHARRLWVPAGIQLADGELPPPCAQQSAKAGKAIPHFPLSRTEPGPKYQWVEKGPEPSRLEEFRYRIAPHVLRRTAADADDASMPDVSLSQVWLELGGDQAARYDEVRRGVLTRLSSGGKVSKQEAENLWLRAWQVTSSLANLDDADSAESVKLDWVTEAMAGDLSGEQVVVYTYFRKTLEDLAARLRKVKVSTTRVWGSQDSQDQAGQITRFTRGHSQVMLITDAGGMGLNLQVARRLILVDTPRSAGRVAQLIGRVKRDGSQHSTVYVTQLLSTTPLDVQLAATVGREAVMQASILDAGHLADEFAWAADDPERLLQAVTG